MHQGQGETLKSETKTTFIRKIGFLLLALIIMALVGYEVFVRNELTKMNQALNSKTQQLSLELGEVEEKSRTQATQIGQLESALPALQQKLVFLTQNDAWVLSEAHYLVFLAKERLQLTQNSALAKSQLEAAQEHLRSLPDDKYASVKLALAKDIVALEHGPSGEKEALWEKVQDLKSHYDSLLFKPLNEPLEVTAKELSDYPRWEKFLSQFQGLIKITREENNPIPQALSTLEKSQVLRMLHLVTDEMQWAILQGQTNIYKEGVEALQKTIKSYFIENEASESLLAQLDKLSEKTPEVALPDISGSLLALEQAKAQLKDATNEKVTTSQGVTDEKTP